MPKIPEANYIVASCKEWHRPQFDAIAREIPGQWYWASTPEELLAILSDHPARYVFFLHWNWLVPKSIWARYECVCFHMTDVPYGRGGSPLQNLIKARHKETKLTALRMVESLDAGPVYAKRPLSLDGRAEEIYVRAGALSMEIARWLIKVEPTPTPQDGKETTFKRRTPAQSVLPDTGSVQDLYDHIRMLDAPGYPHAFVERGNYRMEFTNAQLSGQTLSAHVTFFPVKPLRIDP